MTRLKEIFAWDRDKCLETTKMWTDAHEQDGEPWGILHEMDILKTIQAEISDMNILTRAKASYYKRQRDMLMKDSAGRLVK